VRLAEGLLLSTWVTVLRRAHNWPLGGVIAEWRAGAAWPDLLCREATVSVFYLVQLAYSLHFSTDQYYANVVGFNVDQLIEGLLELGFYLSGKRQEPRIDMRLHNDQPFFDSLLDLVVRVADELGETLREE
jgi:hypothetical protein